jgi:hypothetical protein
MEFNKIRYGRYAVGDYYELIPLKFIYSVIQAWRLLEVIRWNGYNAITRDHLCMHIKNPTKPKLT